MNFDPSTNPIVRVQAGRLRRLLSEYYRRSGKDDEVLIFIAKGQYAPQFGELSEFSSTEQNKKTTISISLQTLLKFFFTIAAAIIIAIFLLYRATNTSPKAIQTSAQNSLNSNYPSIAIVPFQNLTNDSNNDLLKQGFQHQMAADLSYFRVVKPIISELTSLQVLKTKPPIAEYLLEGTFLSTSEDIDMIINLIEVKTGQNIKQFRIKKRIGDDSYFNALVAISSDISGKFAGPEGELVIKSFSDIKNKLESGLEGHQHKNLKAFECMTLFNAFTADKTVENFNHAAGCLKYQLSQYKNDSTLLSAYAWITVYGSPESGLFEKYQVKGDYSLTKALDLAHQAITINPTDSHAYEYMALIQWKSGKHQAAIQSIRRSIQLNPAASGNLANLGHFLCFTGDWEGGLPALEQALQQNPNAPYWYYTPLFMKSVLDKDGKNAMIHARNHNDISEADGGVYVLIAAAMLGDEQTIKTYVPIIKAYAKKHQNDPLYVTRRWVQSRVIIEALEAQLIAVGISVPKI